MKSMKVKNVLGALAIIVYWGMSGSLLFRSIPWIGTMPMQEFEVQNWLRFVFIVGCDLLLTMLIVSLYDALRALHRRSNPEKNAQRQKKARWMMIMVALMASEWMMVLGVITVHIWKLSVAPLDGVLCVAAILMMVLFTAESPKQKAKQENERKSRRVLAIARTALTMLSCAAVIWSSTGLLMHTCAWFLRIVCMMVGLLAALVILIAWLDRPKKREESVQKPEE